MGRQAGTVLSSCPLHLGPSSTGYSKAAHVAFGLLLTAIITLVISSTVIAFLDQNTSTSSHSRSRSRSRGRGIDFRRG